MSLLVMLHTFISVWMVILFLLFYCPYLFCLFVPYTVTHLQRSYQTVNTPSSQRTRISSCSRWWPQLWHLQDTCIRYSECETVGLVFHCVCFKAHDQWFTLLYLIYPISILHRNFILGAAAFLYFIFTWSWLITFMRNSSCVMFLIWWKLPLLSKQYSHVLTPLDSWNCWNSQVEMHFHCQTHKTTPKKNTTRLIWVRHLVSAD